MPAFATQICSLGILLVYLPRKPTLAWNSNLVGCIGSGTPCRVGKVGEPFPELPLFEEIHCILSIRDVLGKEIVEIVGHQRIIHSTCIT